MIESWGKWPDADKQAMIAEYTAGATTEDLAAKHHHNRRGVSAWLRALGILRRQGPQSKSLASLQSADKGRTAGILAEYRKGTPIYEIRLAYKVGSAVLYRITDRAGLPRREPKKTSIQQKRVKPVFAVHDTSDAERLAVMRSSPVWAAFFMMRLEGHGPAYSVHVIHALRRQTVGRDEAAHE